VIVQRFGVSHQHTGKRAEFVGRTGHRANAVSTRLSFGAPWVRHGAPSTHRRSCARLSGTREADGPGGPSWLGAPPVHRRGGRTKYNRRLPARRDLAALLIHAAHHPF